MRHLLVLGWSTLLVGCASPRVEVGADEARCPPADAEASVYQDPRTRLAVPSDSSKVVLHGYVRSRNTRHPVAGVLVAAAAEGSTVTNEVGVYRLEVTPTLSGTLLFSKPEHAPLHFALESVIPKARLDVELRQCTVVLGW